jgi:hypothetical protein
MPSPWQKLAAGFLIGVLLLDEIAGIAAAQTTIIAGSGASGGHVSLPAPVQIGKPPPNTSGLTISIDTVWLPANGYRPVRVTVKPVAPTTSDRTLQIRLTPVAGGYAHSFSVRVTRMIDVPAGSSASLTVPVPQWEAWQGLQLDVLEDGQQIDELSAAGVFPNSEVSFGGVSAPIAPPFGNLPAILLLGVSQREADAAPDRILFHGGNGLFHETRFLLAGTLDLAGAPPARDPSFPSVAGLPDQWLDYSGIDVVVLPFDQLRDLVKNHPSQWAAIRSMVAAGGNLWVYGVGDRWQRLAELEELFDLGPQAPATGDGAKATAIREWKKPDPKPDTANPTVQGVSGDDSRSPPFVNHALCRGQIVAIGADNIFADQKFDWAWLLDTIDENRWQWGTRSGVVLDPAELGSNATNFWQFLIPGVGLTPVLQFQILISLFVIVIGPVNYLLLRRWQRLNLLPITVGASAAAVTLALFAYALVHDGLGVRVRARSFTELDQRRGEAVCWSRLSYYAGLSPSRGLTFSGDVAVYPLRFESERTSRSPQNRPPREMEWVAAEPNAADPLPSQHFPGDWLPARTPTQFVTVRARKTAARLDVVLSDQQGGVSKIENHLGGRIRLLVLTDSTGRAFAAESVSDDESATVREMESSAAHARIAKLILDNDLQFPAGTQGTSFQGNQRYSTYSPNPTPAPVETETILERSLHHASDLPPRSFVAIMETSPEVELGISSAREESSLHVIVGKW